ISSPPRASPAPRVVPNRAPPAPNGGPATLPAPAQAHAANWQRPKPSATPQASIMPTGERFRDPGAPCAPCARPASGVNPRPCGLPPPAPAAANWAAGRPPHRGGPLAPPLGGAALGALGALGDGSPRRGSRSAPAEWPRPPRTPAPTPPLGVPAPRRSANAPAPLQPGDARRIGRTVRWRRGNPFVRFPTDSPYPIGRQTPVQWFDGPKTALGGTPGGGVACARETLPKRGGATRTERHVTSGPVSPRAPTPRAPLR